MNKAGHIFTNAVSDMKRALTESNLAGRNFEARMIYQMCCEIMTQEEALKLKQVLLERGHSDLASDKIEANRE